MKTKLFINVATLTCMILCSYFIGGCSLRRRSFSTSVDLSNEQRETEQLKRNEYKTLKTANGKDTVTQTFILWFPAGNQGTQNEVINNAYFDAVNKTPKCDGMIMAREKTKRITIPLLLVTFIIRKAEVEGRCIQILDSEKISKQ